MNLVFFGTSRFAAVILRSLLDQNFPIAAIVTRPDRKKGRRLQLLPPEVKVCAQRFAPHLPLFQPERASTPEFAAVLEAFEPDLFVVAAYGEIIKQFLLDMPRIDCINVHASLLPKYRGAAPIQRCLMAGDAQTGITIISMVAQMDAGDMLAQKSMSIPQEMNAGELEHELAHMGAQLVSQVIAQLKTGTEERIPQDHAQMTLAPKLMPEEEQIHWDLPAPVIHNLVRALAPAPGAWTPLYVNQEPKRLKIKRTRPRAQAHTSSPGAFLSCTQKEWVVACKEGALELLEVQLEGKKSVTAQEFVRGMRVPFSLASGVVA